MNYSACFLGGDNTDPLGDTYTPLAPSSGEQTRVVSQNLSLRAHLKGCATGPCDALASFSLAEQLTGSHTTSSHTSCKESCLGCLLL